MARANVYLPDGLAEVAKEADLNLSAITQHAVRQVLAQQSTDAWLSALAPASPDAATHEHVLAALDAARDEPSSQHG